MFKSIEIHDWRQFSSVKVDFHEKPTVLTGANGAGKTTILNLLNRHFGWNLQLVGTPRTGRKGVIRFFSDLWKFRQSPSDITTSEENVIGKIVYGDGSEAQLSIPHEVTNQYQVTISKQQNMRGLFISSHRPVYFYQTVTQIPTSISASDQLLDNYLNEIRSRYSTN